MNAYIIIFLSIITGNTRAVPAYAYTEDEAITQASEHMAESWIYKATHAANLEFIDIPF